MIDSVPSILILKAPRFEESNLIEKICWGIEEEGIPFEVRTDIETDAVRLAYKASLSSNLNVGIGIGSDLAIAVHYSQMEERTPLFIGRGDSRNSDPVVMGINAARLVKGIPFKGLLEQQTNWR